jgi:hypothetical protein
MLAYQAKAGLGIDPLGPARRLPTLPARCWHESGNQGLDHASSRTITPTNFPCWVRSPTRTANGQSRQFFTQFQGVTGNDLAQFRDTAHQVILWPAEFKTGNIIYPYEDAKK